MSRDRLVNGEGRGYHRTQHRAGTWGDNGAERPAWRKQQRGGRRRWGGRDTREAAGTQPSRLVAIRLQETFAMEGETGFQVGGKHHSCVTRDHRVWGGERAPMPSVRQVVTRSIRRSEGVLRRKDVLATEGKRALLPEQSSVSPSGAPLPDSQSSCWEQDTSLQPP